MRPPGLLVLAVLGLHLLAGHEVQRMQDGWRRDDTPPMPPRMAMEFTQAMTLSAPRPAARAPAPPPAPPAVSPAAVAHGNVPAGDTPAPAASAPDRAASEPAAARTLPAPTDATTEPALPVAPQSAASAASAAAPDEPGPGPEWPLSTRLSYQLTGHYRGPVSGQAQVEWMRKGKDYQVSLDVSVGPVSRRMLSQGTLTPQGIAPQRYDEETRVLLLDTRRSTVFFLGAEVQLATGVRERAAFGGQDAASQFVQLTWLFLTGREVLEPGRLVQFPLVLPRRQYAWQYEVLGEELLQTPMGPLATWHLKPTRVAVSGDLSADVWLAPALQYLPVRLLIRQDADTFIDLNLQAAPLQAAPESSDNPSRRSRP
ncbi:DUF3108 domain-containing protein [Roseateles sp. BYS87W]|uniref:DUF3108 domain-containing protein n=1 Tax=Pelomonas baiyunensis TaxID=3299026 RepID=UPI003748085A